MPRNESKKSDPRLARAIAGLRSKRAKIVVAKIIEKGFITTEDLKNMGYNHPPRAARDVREGGIPLETFKVKDEAGVVIAAYRFGDLDEVQHHKLGGRRTFPKDLAESLYQQSGGRCHICGGKYELRYLQVDHRIPYEIAGDKVAEVDQTEEFMLLCGSCQRKKSWSCEHCKNWKDRVRTVCAACYWAKPEDYSHAAMEEMRRLDVLFAGEEVATYDDLAKDARVAKTTVSDLAKERLKKK